MAVTPYLYYEDPKRLGQATQCLYLTVQNVDRDFERAIRAGASVLEKPHEEFYSANLRLRALL